MQGGAALDMDTGPIDAGAMESQPHTVVTDEMVADFVFCPRFAHLKWVQGESADSGGADSGGAEETRASTSHWLSLTRMSWDALGVSVGIERIEYESGESLPVRTCSVGRAEGATASASDAVALCIQGLVLRANSHLCNAGLLHCEGDGTTIRVSFDEKLLAQAYDAVFKLREMLAEPCAPIPLAGEDKCTDCAYAITCMPDEIAFMEASSRARASLDEDASKQAEVRRLVPARDDRLPLHVQVQGAVISRKDQVVEVRVEGKTASQTRMIDLSQVCVYGNVQVTTQAIRGFCSSNIPVCYFSRGGWFYGITQSTMGKNVLVRMAQYDVVTDPDRALSISRRFVAGKIRNCRTLLRRNCPDCDQTVLSGLSEYADRAISADQMPSLLGIEGAAASAYFGSFGKMLSSGAEFDFKSRNRRPPKDPVNAVLSYLYSMLVKDFTVAAMAAGLDPYAGFYHQPLQGRPALALDLMEEFRPLICDSIAIRLVNTSALKQSDFTSMGDGVAMSDEARRKVIAAYEARLDSLVTHPLFGYSISYRRVLSVQAGLVKRWLLGEIDSYLPFCTR